MNLITKNNSLDIEDSDIASQAFTFFLGGFDTMATTFSFLSHRLALHPEIQTKVRDEVKEVMDKNNGKMTYESLKDLKYMDMVIAGQFLSGLSKFIACAFMPYIQTFQRF
jgi:cytochrome P450 family 6